MIQKNVFKDAVAATETGRHSMRRSTDDLTQGWRPVPAPQAPSRQPQYVIIAERLMERTPVDAVVLKRRRETEEQLLPEQVMFGGVISRDVADRFKAWAKDHNFTVKSSLEQALREFLDARSG